MARARKQPETPASPPEAAAVPDLAAFVAQHEQAAQDLGVVVVSITHPDAAPGIRQGAYSGIRMKEGDPSAVYSDGSRH